MRKKSGNMKCGGRNRYTMRVWWEGNCGTMKQWATNAECRIQNLANKCGVAVGKIKRLHQR